MKTEDPLLSACQKIIMRLGADGGFVLVLANAIVQADKENLETLRPAAEAVLRRHKLL